MLNRYIYVSIFTLFDRTKNRTTIEESLQEKARGIRWKTDVEQTSNNYESIGSPTKSNSARIPARMNNQIGTSVPHIPRNERRNVNQQRVRFTDPPLSARPSISLSLSFFFFLFQEDTSTIPRYERRGIDVVTRCLGSNSICMVDSPVFRRRRDYSKNRTIESERLWTDPWKIENVIEIFSTIF